MWEGTSVIVQKNVDVYLCVNASHQQQLVSINFQIIACRSNILGTPHFYKKQQDVRKQNVIICGFVIWEIRK